MLQQEIEQLEELALYGGGVDPGRSLPPTTRRPALTLSPTDDRLLNVEEAAGRLGVSMDYLYRHSKQLPFTRRMGRKLLFSSHGINEYIRRGRR